MGWSYGVLGQSISSGPQVAALLGHPLYVCQHPLLSCGSLPQRALGHYQLWLPDSCRFMHIVRHWSPTPTWILGPFSALLLPDTYLRGQVHVTESTRRCGEEGSIAPWCAGKCLTTGFLPQEGPWFIAFADFCGFLSQVSDMICIYLIFNLCYAVEHLL